MAGRNVLLVDRGDLASLAVATLEAERGHPLAWHFLEPDVAGPRRLAAAEEHAEALGLGPVLVTRPGAVGLDDFAPEEGLFESHLLLQAVTVARQVGCRRIVWPRHVGPDPERVGVVVERATRVAELAAIDEPRPPAVIDVPLVDLTDVQVAELADDSGGPMRAFWPCETGGEEPCGRCPGCQRWRDAFEQAGPPWPWAARPVA
ncbi:MAG: 7-cyano-7-deazaguanine synthase [Planctomycetota bacterium]